MERLRPLAGPKRLFYDRVPDAPGCPETAGGSFRFESHVHALFTFQRATCAVLSNIAIRDASEDNTREQKACQQSFLKMMKKLFLAGSTGLGRVSNFPDSLFLRNAQNLRQSTSLPYLIAQK